MVIPRRRHGDFTSKPTLRTGFAQQDEGSVLRAAGLVEEGFPLERDRKAPSLRILYLGGGRIFGLGIGPGRQRLSATDGLASLLYGVSIQCPRHRAPLRHGRRGEEWRTGGGPRRRGDGGSGVGGGRRGEVPRGDILGTRPLGSGVVLLYGGGERRPVWFRGIVVMRRRVLGVRAVVAGGSGSGGGGGQEGGHHGADLAGATSIDSFR